MFRMWSKITKRRGPKFWWNRRQKPWKKTRCQGQINQSLSDTILNQRISIKAKMKTKTHLREWETLWILSWIQIKTQINFRTNHRIWTFRPIIRRKINVWNLSNFHRIIWEIKMVTPFSREATSPSESTIAWVRAFSSRMLKPNRISTPIFRKNGNRHRHLKLIEIHKMLCRISRLCRIIILNRTSIWLKILPASMGFSQIMHLLDHFKLLKLISCQLQIYSPSNRTFSLKTRAYSPSSNRAKAWNKSLSC